MRAGRLVQGPLIQDEGVLCSKGMRADIGNELYYTYRTWSTENLHSTALFVDKVIWRSHPPRGFQSRNLL
jgi:hypothetical protein